MRVIEVNTDKFDLSKFKKRTALEQDATQFIDFDCLITQGGKPIILYKKLTIDTAHLRKAIREIKYAKTDRTAGLQTESATFGYRPRVVMRADYCTATMMSQNDAKRHAIIAGFAEQLTEYYKKFFPEVFSQHCSIVEAKIKKDWVIPNSPFTSGIVNKNNPLKYHHDSGNFKGVLSNMVVFKRDTKGGHLSCPEYNLMFECADNTVLIFDGQSILHGVTPIHNLTKDAYRYTAVYYSLEQMWKCDTINEELLRIRAKKLEREIKRTKAYKANNP